MPIAILTILLIFPLAAEANSMAPIFPVLSGLGWIAMPLIICIEYFYYRNRKINNSFKLALYSNVASALVGLILAFLTFWFMGGPAIENYSDVILISATITFAGILFHWWLSSIVEYQYSKRHVLWKNSGLSKSIFYKANGITYALILAVFIFQFASFFI
jgi:hypothetical protein